MVYEGYVACVAECKDVLEPVNFDPISKLRSRLMRRPASTIGCVFSVSGFTDPAIYLTGLLSPQTILLWGKAEIAYVLENGCIRESLLKKFRHFTEQCVPDFNTMRKR